MITYSDIKNNENIKVYIKKADESLLKLGYTEHSFAHVGLVAKRSEYILSTLGYSQREVELAKISAHLHDIGNIVQSEEVWIKFHRKLCRLKNLHYLCSPFRKRFIKRHCSMLEHPTLPLKSISSLKQCMQL